MGSCKTPCYPHGDVVRPLNGGIWWMQKQKKIGANKITYLLEMVEVQKKK